MTAYTMNCPPLDCGPCGTLPSGFVRLRYFYGKRLGVADLLDEQRYHSGKLRFHQQRMHGSGVLCGLRVEPFSNDPADATIMRVRRGAAVDGCGRDIIVGYDQCIDLEAWLSRKLQQNPSFLTNAAPNNANELSLCVVLRYRECPAHPEPAPRDPCSCDAGGCDFGRVREEFELDLIAKPTEMIVPAIFPPRDKLLPAVAASPGGAALVDNIAVLATDSCPAPDAEGWLELACFVATLAPAPNDPNGRKHITAFSGIEAAETVLYETALLQELLTRTTAATMEAGSLADGPQIDEVTLDDPANPASLVIRLTAPVLASTVPANSVIFVLYELDPTTGWGPVITTTTSYDPTGTGTFTVKPASGTLAEGALLRLVRIEPSSDNPMVDASMRPLRPLRFSFHFTLIKDPNDATKLIIAAPPIVP
jgi:hypothetical protein